MNRALYRTAALATLQAALLIAGCKPAGAPAGMAQRPPPEVAVYTAQAEAASITVDLPGRTAPYLVADVRPQVSGIIQKRLFVEGGDVKEGDLLYQIDPAMYQAAHDSAKAALARAEATLPPLRNKADRYKELVAIKAVSQQEYDDILAVCAQSKADIEAARAALEAARINLAYTRVTAPAAGRIGRSLVTVGALVTANQPAPLATIQQLDPIYVDVTQSSASLLRMKQSLATGRLQGARADEAKVKLILEEGSHYPIEGTMGFRDVTVDPVTGSVTLRMIFPNPDNVLLPGMYVRAVVQEGVQASAILLPQQCVSRNMRGEATCYVVNASDKIESRILKVDRAVGNKWLVREGVASGDRIVAEGFQRIAPGVAVKAVPFMAQAAATPATAAGAQPPAAKH